MTTGDFVQLKWNRRQLMPFLKIPLLMVKWKRGQETGCLTPRTYALSPKIPQNRKVIGGGHRIGQLWKDKKEERRN